jgi:hypothetical protein
MSDVAMTPVNSSNIKAIGKDGDWLHVQFNSGHTWRYKNAAHHYDEMLKPGVSRGKYFHRHIRMNSEHPAEPVERMVS